MKGEWHLRIDDIDPYRNRPGSVDEILASLEALGLHWDGPIAYQSQRIDLYRAALKNLQEDGLIYPCSCSRSKLTQLSNGKNTIPYPGFCRPGFTTVTGEHSLRLVTGDAEICFTDRVQGPITQKLAAEVGDFVIYRRDNVFAYHLATVVDDDEQGITHILRGRDLLSSTPRQIYIQQLLGLPTPNYAHTPLIIDANGKKLSKRSFAAKAETTYPSEILRYLLKLLRHPAPDDSEHASVSELLVWAIQNWQLTRLEGTNLISLQEFSFSL